MGDNPGLPGALEVIMRILAKGGEEVRNRQSHSNMKKRGMIWP